MENVVTHLGRLLLQKDRVTYDLRSSCQVYSGVVCALGTTEGSERITEPPLVIAHALSHVWYYWGLEEPRCRHDALR